MVKCVYVDESAYLPEFQQREIRSAAEGFLAKPNSTDLHIIFVSTAAAPTGMFYDMEREEPSLYHKKVYDYRYGLQGEKPIYLQSAILQAMKSPDWGREYLGLYSGIIGSCFSIASLDRAVALGAKYDVKPESWHKDIHTILAIDPAYSAASKYGIVMTQYIGGEIVVIYAKAFTKPDYSEMINEVFKLSRQVGGVANILVDASAPEVISSIRRAFHRDQYSDNYLKEIVDNTKKFNIPLERRLFVVPKNFREGKQMLQHAVELLDEPSGLVAIPAVHEDLLTGLRTAVADSWDLDKKKSVNSDLIDALLMCLSVYKFTE